MGMYDDIQKDYMQARRDQDKFATSVLNLMFSDLKYEKINKQKDVEDADVIAYLQKTLKQRKEVLVDYEKAGRTDLIEKENAEIAFISKYMPAMMSDDDIRKLAITAKQTLGASSPADMGKLIKAVMVDAKGKADGAKVKDIVMEVLKS